MCVCVRVCVCVCEVCVCVSYKCGAAGHLVLRLTSCRLHEVVLLCSLILDKPAVKEKNFKRSLGERTVQDAV